MNKPQEALAWLKQAVGQLTQATMLGRKCGSICTVARHVRFERVHAAAWTSDTRMQIALRRRIGTPHESCGRVRGFADDHTAPGLSHQRRDAPREVSLLESQLTLRAAVRCEVRHRIARLRLRIRLGSLHES